VPGNDYTANVFPLGLRLQQEASFSVCRAAQFRVVVGEDGWGAGASRNGAHVRLDLGVATEVEIVTEIGVTFGVVTKRPAAAARGRFCGEGVARGVAGALVLLSW
jgi:hypothetical protein